MNKLIYLALSALIAFASCETSQPAENATTETSTESDSKTVKGIDFFEGSWSDALAKAKEENKLIFLDISASWCGPCKELKRTTFKDQTVGDYYNDRFINVELDGEKGDGIALVEKYRLRAYPSLYFVDGEEKIVQQTTGFLPAEQFLQFGKSVVK
jgi:thiol:disulfide interchange protein